MSFLNDIDDELRAAGVVEAVVKHRTAPIFDWLVKQFSYQGISDQAARSFMEEHGSATWSQISSDLRSSAACPKLRSYWRYDGCGYKKTAGTCGKASLIASCPVPRLPLRNGRLNQIAYSFYLFIRDIADGDIVAWIDARLGSDLSAYQPNLNAAREAALIGPLRNVFGVSDKLLGMAMANLLIGAGRGRPDWFETGVSMLAVDSLVHAFLARTGITNDCGQLHAYGPACYAAGGCADLLRRLSGSIDASAFNASFPVYFPRFVQHAIWRFCAADGLDVCNSNRIDDRRGCRDIHCRLGPKCHRKRPKM